MVFVCVCFVRVCACAFALGVRVCLLFGWYDYCPASFGGHIVCEQMPHPCPQLATRSLRECCSGCAPRALMPGTLPLFISLNLTLLPACPSFIRYFLIHSCLLPCPLLSPHLCSAAPQCPRVRDLCGVQRRAATPPARRPAARLPFRPARARRARQRRPGPAALRVSASASLSLSLSLSLSCPRPRCAACKWLVNVCVCVQSAAAAWTGAAPAPVLLTARVSCVRARSCWRWR